MANSDAISIIKQKFISEIVNDKEIVHAFGSPNYDPTDADVSGEDVGDNYIFTWNQNPNTINETITFITIQVNIQKSKENFVKPTVVIYLYTHNEHMKLEAKDYPGISGNRNDYLSRLLDKKFNGRNSLGLLGEKSTLRLIGELTLIYNCEEAYNADFSFRKMIFETLDINNSFCDRW